MMWLRNRIVAHIMYITRHISCMYDSMMCNNQNRDASCVSHSISSVYVKPVENWSQSHLSCYVCLSLSLFFLSLFSLCVCVIYTHQIVCAAFTSMHDCIYYFRCWHAIFPSLLHCTKYTSLSDSQCTVTKSVARWPCVLHCHWTCCTVTKIVALLQLRCTVHKISSPCRGYASYYLTYIVGFSFFLIRSQIIIRFILFSVQK